LLRNINETGVLKYFVPPTLFAETSLPQVCVEAERTKEKRPERVSEDLEDAINTYTPGRVTYRILPEEGSIIPINIPRNLRGISVMKDALVEYDRPPLFDYSPDSMHEALVSELPEAYRKLVSEKMGSLMFDAITPLSIRTKHYAPGGRVVWGIYGKSMVMRQLSEGSTIRSPPLYVLDKTSNSYPFVLNAFHLPGGRSEAISSINNNLPFIGFDPVIKFERGGKGIVGRFVYGFIFRGHARLFKEGAKNAVSLERLMSRTRVNIVGFGIPALSRMRDGLKPVIYGYFIKDTNVFSLEIPKEKDFINDLLSEFTNAINALNSGTDLSRLNIRERYILLALNDIIYNSMIYALTNDILLMDRLQFANLNDVLKTYLIYAHVILEEHIFEPKELPENISKITEKIREIIRTVAEIDSKYFDKRAFALDVLKCVLECKGTLWGNGGERLKSFMKALDEIVFLTRLGSNDQMFVVDLLSFVLKHTIYHAFIREVLATVGGVHDRLLQEGSLRSPWKFPSHDVRGEMYIFEVSDGGLGAIETAIQYYAENPLSLIDRLIRAIGHCIIGIPEDLVYYSHLKSGNLKRVVEDAIGVLDSVVKELGMIVLREELDEAQKLLLSLASEHGGKGLKYLEDALKARSEFEERFLRTPTTEELALYILKRLPRYPYIRDYLTEALTALVKRPIYDKYRDVINDYKRYKHVSDYSDYKELAEKFLDDASSLLNGGDSLLRFVNEGGERDRGKRWKFICELMKASFETLLASFSRYFFLTCVSACGWCYLNTGSCEETRDPSSQTLVLDRRLANLYLSWALLKALENNRNGRVIVSRGVKGDVVIRVGGEDISISISSG